MKINEIFKSVCGEGTELGQIAVFVRFTGCDMRCNYCIAENTPVLMADYSWKPIQEVLPGDHVMGLLPRTEKFKTRMFGAAKVTNAQNRKSSDIVQVSTSDGAVCACTREHRFYNHTWREYWQQAQNLQGKSIFALSQHSAQNSEGERGWLAGAIAGDGCFHVFKGKYPRLILASIDNEMLEKAEDILHKKGYHPRRHRAGNTINSVLYKTELTRGDEALSAREWLLPLSEGRMFPSKDYMRGYLGGLFDAEGYQDWQEIRISQNPGNVLDTASEYLKELGFRFQVRQDHSKVNTIRVLNPLRFYSECPTVLLRKHKEVSVKTSSERHKCTVQPLNGTAQVYDLTTSCGNFIAGGFIVHNCDTAYSFEGGEERTVDELIEMIKSFGVKRIFWTGGEPMLWENEIKEVVHRLTRHDGWFHILQTNGKHLIEPGLLKSFDLVSIDYKGPSAGPQAVSNDEVILHALQESYRNIQIKFLIQDQVDYDFAKEKIQKFCEIDQFTDSYTAYILGPVGGVNMKELAEKVIADDYLGTNTNVRVGCQVHKLLWGNKRGV